MSTLSGWLRDGVLRSALETSFSCVTILDLNGRIRFMNRAGLTAWEFDAPSVAEGLPWKTLWPAEAGGRVQSTLEAAVRGETARFEAEAPTRRGGVKWWDVKLSPLRNDTGELGGVIANCRDVSDAYVTRQENKARSRGQARSEIVLRAASRIAQLGGWEFDCATRDVYFSEVLANAMGRGAEVNHSDALQSWHEEDAAEFSRTVEEAAAFGRSFTFEGRIMTDGVIRWLRVIGEPEIVDGWCVALRGASQDVTEWREAVAQLQASEQTALRATEAMSSFLTTMSHELRTPLNGVLGMAQVMARGELSDLQRAHLQTIQTSGESLLGLLNDLLDLAKIKAGRFELERGEFDAAEVAAEARIFEGLLHDKGVRLDVVVDPSAAGRWAGDAKRVGQVLHNLVSNAVKFTERGVISVEFSGASSGLIIQVRDTGIGIPQEKLSTVFEEFTQADASMSRRYGGSGLGLAICRDLVTLMSGEIRAQSMDGVGSVFTVELPLKRLEEARGSTTISSRQPESVEERSLLVLAAEDNATNQMVLKTLLQTVGITPVIVDNGQDAVAAWGQRSWDLVLMDVQMPVMDGVSAARAIRQAETRDRRVRTPIIALTANAMAHQRAEYVAAGMDDVVSKPISIVELLSAIDRALCRNDEADRAAG